jgi:hypothetical protein
MNFAFMLARPTPSISGESQPPMTPDLRVT